jgi:hypothetical protein
LSQELRPLSIQDYSGETQTCAREQKAEEEPKRFDKAQKSSNFLRFANFWP